MKILMIGGQNFITKRNDGGKQCSYRVLELLRKACDETDLVVFTNDRLDEENEHYRMPAHANIIARTINILSGHMFTSKLNEQAVITKIKTERFDTVLLDRSMFGKLAFNLKHECPDIKIWVFLHNIEKNYFKNKIKNKNPLFMLPYRAICKSELDTLHYADKVFALTKRDSDTLYEQYGIKADQILPMAYYDSFDESKHLPEESLRFDGNLLFIGSMFGPNYEGIKWFAKEVMPKLPECNLKIVGKNFETKRTELVSDNVEVIGTVDDLSPYYYGNNVMIMPIPYGDGIKIKTAEAIMFGKVILASDEALEGYDVNDVKGIYRCNAADDYIKVIRQLLDNKSLTFSTDVRQYFFNNLSLDVQIEECKRVWHQE